MPAGVSWMQYLSFSAAALITMLVGSHIVYSRYQPLSDLHVYINKELKNLPEPVQKKIIDELKEEGYLS